MAQDPKVLQTNISFHLSSSAHPRVSGYAFWLKRCHFAELVGEPDSSASAPFQRKGRRGVQINEFLPCLVETVTRQFVPVGKGIFTHVITYRFLRKVCLGKQLLEERVVAWLGSEVPLEKLKRVTIEAEHIEQFVGVRNQEIASDFQRPCGLLVECRSLRLESGRREH